MDAVLQAVSDSGLLHGGERVFVALSGGADSTALLLALVTLRENLHISVEAVHINHCLRGAESDRDEAFCRGLCEKKHIPLTIRRVDAGGEASRCRCSVEVAARNLRYAVFDALLVGENDRIATAHTAQDNTETVLHRLVRGTGLAGLCGIPPRRSSILRPLLFVTRADVLAFLDARQQPFVEDSTNANDAYTRNRLRHHVLPLLLQENPALHHTVAAMVTQLRDEEAYLSRQTDAAYDQCHTSQDTLFGLSSLPVALRRRCVVRFLREEGLLCSFSLVEQALSLLETGGTLCVGRDCFLCGGSDSLSLRRIQPSLVIDPIPLQIGENRVIPGCVCHVAVTPADVFTKTANVHEKFTNYSLDYDRIIGVAVFRGRRPGDTIVLAGRSFSSRVKKLLQERVPKEQRPFLHYLADDAGLIWIEGIGIAARVAPDAHTKTSMSLTVVRSVDKE